MRKICISIIGLILISACSLQGDTTPSSEIVDQIESAKEVQKTVDLRLNKTKITPKTFKVSILLTNLEKKEILSTRTWLSYNPEDLKIIKIDTQNSDFNLAAPGENEYDAEKGIIKIGRSNVDQEVSLPAIQIAEITVEKINTGTTVIDFYDYHKDQSGHTNVNILRDGQIYNLAKEPTSPGVVIE